MNKKEIFVNNKKENSLAFTYILYNGANKKVKIDQSNEKEISFVLFNQTTNKELENIKIYFKTLQLKKDFIFGYQSFLKNLYIETSKKLNEYSNEKTKYSEYKDYYVKDRKTIMLIINNISTHFNIAPPSVKIYKKLKYSKSKNTSVNINNRLKIEPALYILGRTNKKTHGISFFGVPIKFNVLCHEYAHYYLLEKGETNIKHDEKHDKAMNKIFNYAVNNPEIKNKLIKYNFK